MKRRRVERQKLRSAREMRGELNAVDIPTKRAPGLKDRDFFSDEDYAANCAAIDEAMAQIPPGATGAFDALSQPAR
jgi:hypothetical protein